jgi:hypothetical protein
VSDREHAEAVERLRLTLDLFDAGESMMRQALRRRFPEEDQADIERRLNAWLGERPGAEDGDGPIRRVRWPRPPRP